MWILFPKYIVVKYTCWWSKMAEKLSKWQLNIYYSKSCVPCNNKYRHRLTNTKECWYQHLNKLNPSAEQVCPSLVVAIDVVHARITCCFLTHKNRHHKCGMSTGKHKLTNDTMKNKGNLPLSFSYGHKNVTHI